ncbi:hypothetical protein [Catenulispora pinisilvae]|uniref:hypothetical protein n=1 Tax=Catenulispora pinisilvae TaxID=2705253 RepID=UPI001890BB40|nr:hypothetical protein [Catenulispora pinisilvae]
MPTVPTWLRADLRAQADAVADQVGALVGQDGVDVDAGVAVLELEDRPAQVHDAEECGVSANPPAPANPRVSQNPWVRAAQQASAC